MGKATLVVMAAGIGSRFGGGIKQLEPVGPSGELIIDYSIYDAKEAGFDRVVFVIRKDLEEEFKARIGDRIAKTIAVEYAFQEVEDIPQPFRQKYAGRKKPWGTGQAILVCKDLVQEPFLVINADDYYGRSAYRKAYEHLTGMKRQKDVLSACMVAFQLKHTVSENGAVTRGLCRMNQKHQLIGLDETGHIVKTPQGIGIQTDAFYSLDGDMEVSMNMWGFSPEIFERLQQGFERFLETVDPWDKKEYLLPDIVDAFLRSGQIEVTVLRSEDEWFGVTYKEDKDTVVKAIQKLLQEGKYPSSL